MTAFQKRDMRVISTICIRHNLMIVSNNFFNQHSKECKENLQSTCGFCSTQFFIIITIITYKNIMHQSFPVQNYVFQSREMIRGRNLG